MKLSIVLSTQPASFSALVYKGELATNVAKIANLGYDGVELAVRDPKLLDVEHVKEIITEHSLAVPAIGTGQAYGEEGLSFTHPDLKIREQAIARIKSQIDFAMHFDAVVILGLIRGKIEKHISEEHANSWLIEALKECAGYATSKHVKLALEPINRYESNLIVTVRDGIELTERVASEHFGLLLDTFHMNIEEPDIDESIQTAGDRIFHFHVADSNRWYPGAGHIDFVRILKVLSSVGYDGFVSAEILPLPDPDTCAEQTIKRLRLII